MMGWAIIGWCIIGACIVFVAYFAYKVDMFRMMKCEGEEEKK